MMGLLKLLNIQGFFGLIAAIALGGLLVAEKVEHSRVRDDLSLVTMLYGDERLAHQRTQLNYREAAEEARRADAANKARIEAEQKTITERIERDYEARLADARARAERLRQQLDARSPAHPGSPGATPMPGPGATPGSPDGPAADSRLSLRERLIATEQAIQLDELQRWVREQSTLDVSSSTSRSGSN